MRSSSKVALRSQREKRGRFTFVELALCFAAIIDIPFFYLVSVPYAGHSQKLLLAFFICMLLVIMAVGKGRAIFRCRLTAMDALLILLVACAMLEALYSLATYPSLSVTGLISEFSVLLVPLAAIAFRSAFRARGNYCFLMDVLSVITFIFFLEYIAVSVIYNATGDLILPLMLNDKDIATRNDMIRLYSIPALASPVILYTFVRAVWGDVPKGKRLFYIATCVSGFYGMVFIYQSRMMVISLGVSAAMALLMGRSEGGKIQGNKLLVILVGVLFVAGSGYLDYLVESFFGSDTSYSFSAEARDGAVDYYLAWFLKSPFFGFGFLGGTESLSVIEHGTQGIFYVSDVGFFGQLGRWGLMFAIPYVLIIGRMASVTMRAWERSNRENRALMVGLIVYLVFTTWTLIIYASAYIFGLSVIMSLFEFIYEEGLERQETEERPNAGSCLEQS